MKPKTVSDLDMAFPANIESLMPTEPEYSEYREQWNYRQTWGFKLFGDWFFRGLKKLELKPKEGIDSDAAFRHIRAIMGSFAPKHEDKTAACAFLLEHWFESAEWEAKLPKGT